MNATILFQHDINWLDKTVVTKLYTRYDTLWQLVKIKWLVDRLRLICTTRVNLQTTPACMSRQLRSYTERIVCTYRTPEELCANRFFLLSHTNSMFPDPRRFEVYSRNDSGMNETWFWTSRFVVYEYLRLQISVILYLISQLISVCELNLLWIGTIDIIIISKLLLLTYFPNVIYLLLATSIINIL